TRGCRITVWLLVWIKIDWDPKHGPAGTATILVADECLACRLLSLLVLSNGFCRGLHVNQVFALLVIHRRRLLVIKCEYAVFDLFLANDSAIRVDVGLGCLTHSS